ncbi:MAG TPA: hypothetical protein VFV66_28535 [Nonomuraea sp.]|nr:hypothetical protein [Nonomuraea sp.]
MALPTISIEALFGNIGATGNSRGQTFEGGTNGVVITTGNSGGPQSNNFNSVTGSPQYSTAQAYTSGVLSAVNPSVGVDCHMDWTGVAQSGDVFCARYYLYLVSAPSGTQRTFVLIGPSGTVSAVWLFTDRTLRVYTGFSTAVAVQLSTPIPVGTWVRIELRYTINSGGNGTAEIWQYNDAASVTHTEYAISGTLAWPGGKPQTAEFHLQRDAGGYWYLDNLAVGDSKLGPFVAAWEDLTPYAKHGITTRRGSSRVQSPVIRYEAGTATCTLNNTDRRFDPTNTSGPYVSAGTSRVTPMRPIRIRCVWNGVTYHLFRGFVDEWDVDWVGDVYSEVTVRATDGFKYLQNKRRKPTRMLINGEWTVLTYGEGEDSGARISRVLDSAQWPAPDRVIAVGNSPMQATPLEGDALSELQNVADSEFGELYIDGQGRVVFRNRRAIHTESRSVNVQATFGSPPTSRTPAEAKLATDDATLYNQVIATRAGGIEQEAHDLASQTEYLTRTFQASGLLLTSDGETLNWGQWILFLASDPETRFDELRVHCHADPDALFPLVLPREIGDRIQIVRRPPGGGSDIVRDAFIRGISHEVAGQRWITTFQLQSARQFGGFFTLDDPTLGVLGNGVPMTF